MYVIRRFQGQVDQFIRSGSGKAFALAVVLIGFVVAGVAGLYCKFGSPAMNGRAWDSPIILDGAWRIYNGQVPHRDFYNYLGDLPFYLTALGMKLARPCMGAIDYGNLILVAILVVPVMLMLRRRTSASLAFLYTVFVVFLIVTPRALGDPYDYTDHAMLYNRHGDACMAVYAILLFLPPRPVFGRCIGWGGAVLAGILLTLLFGCKINYFVTGIGLFAVAMVTGRLPVGRAVVVAGSAALTFAIYLALAKIPISALVADYRILMGCQSFVTKFRAFAIQSVKAVTYLPFLLVLVWERSPKIAPDQTGGADWRDWLVALAVFGGSTFILSSNSQIGQLPLLGFGALWGAELILRQNGIADSDEFIGVARRVAAFVLVLFFLLPAIVLDFKTLRYVAYAAVSKRWVSTPTLQQTQLNDFKFVSNGTRGLEMAWYRDQLDDGIQLLRRHPEAAGHLGAFLFSDPFQVALGWKPATGSIIGVADLAINARSHPSLARLVGDATFILTPLGSADMKAVYGSQWDDLHLKTVEKSKEFSLFALPQRHE